MDLEEAIGHALDGRAVLFTGAGFSYGALNIENKAMPSGKLLATDLLKEIGYAGGDTALDKAAAAYLRRKSKKELVQLLINRFSVRHVTAAQIAFASLPWRRVYTTNYDTVFEEARRQAGLASNSIDAVDDPRDHISSPDLILHINGAITRSEPSRIYS